jgi:nitroreductase
MNFLDLARNRQSVRAYQDKPVEREKIERCLEAGRLAPSARNAQPWQFVVIDDLELKDKVARKTFNKIVSFNRFSLQAPVLIIVISENKGIINKIGRAIKNKQFNLVDIGIAVENICLQATEEGLGTCILGWFDETGVKELLNIPQSKTIELIVTMGYPQSSEIRPKKRKELDEIRSYNRYK